MTEGIGPLTRQLLDLPSGLNFTKIVSACVYEADLKATTDLVSGCSDTIEFLDITDCLTGVFPSAELRPTNPYRYNQSIQEQFRLTYPRPRNSKS